MDTSMIDKYMLTGASDMFWYQECNRTLTELYGPGELALVTKLLAATSINTYLKSNITLFRKAYYEIKNDLPVGNYLPNMKKQILQIRAGQELTGRKINSFARAMNGDTEAVVVDIWVLRAFGELRLSLRTSGPHAGHLRPCGAAPNQYNRIESWVRDRAYHLRLEPRQVGSMVWAGCRTLHKGPGVRSYNSILRASLQNLFNVI